MALRNAKARYQVLK